MANGHPWFKDYPGDFLGGTNGMPPYQFAVYVRIIWLMYDTNGPVPYNDRYLAAMCGLGVGTFRKAVDALLQLQKLTLCNGCLSNQRAAQTVAQRAALSATRAAAQVLSVKSRKNKKVNENKENGIAQNSQANSKANSKRIASLEARERESPNRDLSLSNSEDSESKSAARVARVEVARSLRYQAPKTPPPSFEEFWTAYPSNPETDDREAGEIWWSDASDLDRWFAISEIPILLAWINEAPSDPERKIWRAHEWLIRKLWMEVWRRRPDLKPVARAERGEQLAIEIVEVAA